MSEWPPSSDILLAYLGEEMGLDMRRRDGSSIGTLEELAVEKLIRETPLKDYSAVEQLRKAVAEAHTREQARPPLYRRFHEIFQRIRRIAMELRSIPPD